MSDNDVHRRTKASLIIRGDRVDPEGWALYFGMAPSFFAYKGEHWITSSGRPSYRPSAKGQVCFQCCDPNIWAIDAQVKALREKLCFPRADFLTRLARESGHTELWIYVENDDGTNAPIYGAITSDFVAEIKGELIVDVYPDAFQYVTWAVD